MRACQPQLWRWLADGAATTFAFLKKPRKARTSEDRNNSIIRALEPDACGDPLMAGSSHRATRRGGPLGVIATAGHVGPESMAKFIEIPSKAPGRAAVHWRLPRPWTPALSLQPFGAAAGQCACATRHAAPPVDRRRASGASRGTWRVAQTLACSSSATAESALPAWPASGSTSAIRGNAQTAKIEGTRLWVLATKIQPNSVWKWAQKRGPKRAGDKGNSLSVQK